MSKTRPLSEDNILDFLQNDSVSSQQNDDPIAQQLLSVTLDQLQPYELNPRRSVNSKYEEITASIENAGLQEAPKITRRHPDDEKFSIRNGGNTRLSILRELYNKYKNLTELEPDEKKKKDFLEKAESFYRIDCIFIPFQNDIDALSAHMIENEARSGTKFIEKALVVNQYKKLFKESDEKSKVHNSVNRDEYKEPSSRVLADKISSLGWIVDHSHIIRYNYAVNILLDFIPDALWGGAGQPIVRKISSLFKAYETFWLVTDHGKQNPDKINDLFYKTLSEFDSDKVDLDGFIQELDMRLEDIVKIPSVSIMAEINALMSNSKRSLKHEPDALSHRLSVQTNNTGSELSQKPVSSGISNSNDNNQPVKQAAKPSPNSITSKDKIEDRLKKKETQPPYSAGSNSNETQITEVSDVQKNLFKTGKLSSDVPTINALILKQLGRIEELSPGYLGITLMEENYVQEGVLYDVNNFYEPKFHPYPVYGNHQDDMRTMIWWQLQKYSRDYMVNAHGMFTEQMQLVLSSYIQAIKTLNPNNNLIDVILWLEHKLLCYPDILIECVRLQQIQSRIIEISVNQNQSME